MQSSFLLTAADFSPMFDALRGCVPELKGVIDDNLQWAKRVLKREDRVVWYLRWYRYYLTAKEVRRGGPPRLEMLRRQYEGDWIRRGVPSGVFTRDADVFTPSRVRDDLTHLMGMNIPAIDNKRFGVEQPTTLCTELLRIQVEWQNTQKRQLAPHAEDKIILHFPDGWAWFELPRASCDEEADAMGHCGNSPERGNPNMHILSLREPSKLGDKQRWEPHCTFIYNTKNKSIGEAKGRNNDKPVAKYHKYIIALLKLPMIQGVIGGGYLPSHNFKITDLSEELHKDLQLARPDLVSADGNPVAVQRIIDVLELDKDSYDKEEEKFTVQTFSSALEFVKELSSADDVFRLADGSDEPEAPNVSDMTDLLVALCNKQVTVSVGGKYKRVNAPDYVKNIGYRILYEYKDTIPEGFDPEADQDVYDWLEANEPDDWIAAGGLWEELATIWYSTKPSKWGAEQEIADALENITGDNEEGSTYGVRVEQEGGLNDPVALTLELEAAEKLADKVESGRLRVGSIDWADGIRGGVNEYWDDGFASNNEDYTQEKTQEFFGKRPRNPYPEGQERLWKEPNSDAEAMTNGITVASLKARFLQPLTRAA